MSRKGQLSVKTENIFPIIKKWLYSEHDIFLRELVSNACDAITKRASLARTKNQETPEGRVTVDIDKEKKIIEIHDNGVGMSEADVEKYLAELAFSGATEFVEKMKEMDEKTAKEEIIGKFGLGFYSSYMVAERVEVETLSMEEGASPVKWSCRGETEYEFSESDRTEVGTTVRLFINSESEDFLENYKTREVLRKYCDFMPYPIELRDLNWIEKTKEENAKAEKEEDKKPINEDIINDPNPLWKREPSSVKEEEYKEFYRKMFPMDPEPLFWLHLNVDHPFELQGILYFPKINPQRMNNESNIRLYSKQVFVSDNVKNIIPEFLGLLKGAIDSPDIPLNVSRSSLQGDPNIQKISNYVVKKVAESLKKLFLNDREKYERVWEDVGVFVKYGCVSEPKFDELTRQYVIFPTNLEKHVTLSEYRESVPSEFKDKLKEKVLFYEKGKSDLSLLEKITKEKIPAVQTDELIDPHFTQHAEMKTSGDEKFSFRAVDEEYENLFSADDSSISAEVKTQIENLFSTHLNAKVAGQEKEEGEDKSSPDPSSLELEVRSMKDFGSAAYFKVDQTMKRFQHMTQSMGNTPFSMPIKKTLVVNPNHPLIQNTIKIHEKGGQEELVKDLCFHVQDLASIGQDDLDDASRKSFVGRSQGLMEKLSSMVLQ